MQLARAEENSSDDGMTSKGMTTPCDTTARVELQALEDLEKELGLELFKDEPITSSPTPSTLPPKEGTGSQTSGGKTLESVTNPTSATDDLDELEKYLESLTK